MAEHIMRFVPFSDLHSVPKLHQYSIPMEVSIARVFMVIQCADSFRILRSKLPMDENIPTTDNMHRKSNIGNASLSCFGIILNFNS
jgi:hypothetical protein